MHWRPLDPDGKEFPISRLAISVLFYLCGLAQAGEAQPGAPEASLLEPSPAWAKTALETYRSPEYARRVTESRTWYDERFLGAYRKAGRRNPKWDASAESACALMARYLGSDPDHVDAKQVLDACREAIGQGCDDPLIFFVATWVAADRGLQDAQFKYLAVAEKGFIESGYAAALRAQCLSQTIYRDRMLRDWDVHNQHLINSVRRRMDASRALVPSLAADATTPTSVLHKQFFAMLTYQRAMDIGNPGMKPAFEAIFPDYAKAFTGGSFPALLQGDFWARFALEAQSADAVGQGLAKQRVEQAKRFFAEAWRLNPRDGYIAEAWLRVIPYVMATPEEYEQWFGRAVALEPEAGVPFAERLRWLNWRFKGQEEPLLAFGRQCQALGIQAHSIVLINAHWAVAQGRGSSEQALGAYLSDPAVWKEIRSVYEPWLRRFPKAEHQRAFCAKLAYLGGHWADGCELFRPVEEEPNLNVFGSMERFQHMRATCLMRMEGKGHGNENRDLFEIELPWRPEFRTEDDLKGWERIDPVVTKEGKVLTGNWRVRDGTLEQTSNLNGHPNKISTAMVFRGLVQAPCALRFTVEPQDNDMFGVLLGFQNIDNTYQVLFNNDYGPCIQAIRISNGKIVRRFVHSGGYESKIPHEAEIIWSQKELLVRMDGREIIAIQEHADRDLGTLGRIGFFCNGMEGVTFKHVRLERCAASEAYGNQMVVFKLDQGHVADRPLAQDLFAQVKNCFDKEPRARLPALFVFPLLDEGGKTTAAGNLVASEALFRAADGMPPALSYPLLSWDLAEYAGLDKTGRKIPEGEFINIPAMLGTREYWTGTLTREGGAYRATLAAHNAPDGRPFKQKEYAIAGDQLHLLPGRIATDIHAYFGIQEQPPKARPFGEPSFANAAEFLEAAVLATGIPACPWARADAWRRLQGKNQESRFALFMALRAHGKRDDQSTFNFNQGTKELVTRALKCSDDHNIFVEQLLERERKVSFLKKDLYCCLAAINRDPCNHHLYNWLAKRITSEEAKAAWDLAIGHWAKRDPDSAAYHFYAGNAWKDFAWHARDGGWRGAIPEANGDVFRYGMNWARQHLLRAIELNPAGLLAAVQMIYLSGACGDRAGLEKYYGLARSLNPRYGDTYKGHATFLLPAWGGSLAAMKKNAAEVAQDPDLDVALNAVYILFTMSHETGSDADGIPRVLSDPEAWRIVKELRSRIRQAKHQLNSVWHGNFAMFAVMNAEWEIAGEEFEAIDFTKSYRFNLPRDQMDKLRERTLAHLPERPKPPGQPTVKGPSLPPTQPPVNPAKPDSGKEPTKKAKPPPVSPPNEDQEF